MEAICKPDYDIRMKLKMEAEYSFKERKLELEQELRRQNWARKRGFHIKSNDRLEEEVKAAEEKIPDIGYYGIYGVWFYGILVDELQSISAKNLSGPIGNQTHAYINIKPELVPEGTNKLTVYNLTCLMYKWMAQGYHRGLVIKSDDEIGRSTAQNFLNHRTWSWIV